MQKKLRKTTPLFLFSYVLLQILYGVAVLNGWLVLALTLLGLLFGMHRTLPRLRQLLPALFLGNIVFMMTVMSWFRNIDAFGWQNIGPFSPSWMLMLALLLASAFCSVFITLLWFLMDLIMRSARFSVTSSSYIYVWGLAMMLGEIVRTFAFSLFVNHSHAPIEPSLNLFSVGPLIYGTPLSPLSRLFGFWGSSFIIFMLSSLLYVGVSGLLMRRTTVINRTFMRNAAFGLGVILGVFIFSSVTFRGSAGTGDSIDVVGVSQRQNTYLKEVVDQLSRVRIDKPTVVVLPEYSELLHPYSDASLFNPTYDGRDDIPKRLADKPVFFVGTEDELSKNGRYVETYIVDTELQKIKRTEKTFLIPGGEYIPPLVGKAVERIDAYAVINFSNSRSRKVLGDQLAPDMVNAFARDIGTGPCSAILTPFHFRQQVAEGAVLLTSNVSYEQFARAPEYRAYTHRFAQFTAYSTARPFVIGARAGESIVYGADGKALASSGPQLTATHSFNDLSSEKTVYVLLGDAFIVGMLIIIGLLLINASQLVPLGRLIKKTLKRN